MSLKVVELFGGIGACSKALEKLGIDYEIVDYVEIDKYAVKSFNAMHGTNFETQDICEWDKDIIADLIMHGSPCQDFSLAGKQAGGDEGSGTRSSLMYETLRIVGNIRPKYVVWENVKNVISKKHIHNFDAYLRQLERLGYNNYWRVLNAKDYGIPQNRERIFVISVRHDIDDGQFNFPKPIELKLRLKDILEETVAEKYYLSDAMKKYISANNEKWTGNNSQSLINKSIASTINTGEGSRRCDASNYIAPDIHEEDVDLKVIRKFGLFDTETSKHQAGSVYDSNGLSPTLDTMQGGWRQPLVEEQSFVGRKYKEFVEENGYVPNMFNPYNKAEIKDVAPTQTTQCGSTTSSATVLITNEPQEKTLWTETQAKMITEEGNVKRYINSDVVDKFEEGQCADISFPNGYNKANRVHDVCPAINLTTTKSSFIYKEPVIVGSTQKHAAISRDGICPTLTSAMGMGGGHVPMHNYDYRIRKLTPKECWRLQAFSDEDFEKARVVNSDTQLYKQAGNSICVSVLEAIFKELLGGKY